MLPATTLPSRPARARARRTVGGLCAALVASVGVLLPTAASAHVTVQPGEVEGGGFSVVTFRVPTERDDASTDRVQVLFPEAQPVGSVRTRPMPGWKVTTKTRTLDEPIEMFGEEVDEVVSEVTWTSTGDGIGPGEYEDFDVSLGPLLESGEMVFNAIQTYYTDEVVKWNEVAVDDSVEPEHPAPVLTITAPPADPIVEGTGDDADAAGADDAAADDEATDDDEDQDDEADSPVLPYVLSGLALLVALAALALAWRRRG